MTKQETIDWEQRRYEIAAVRLSDALIEELKKENNG